jgi:hypothetical protein
MEVTHPEGGAFAPGLWAVGSGPIFRRIRRAITDRGLTAQTICLIVNRHAVRLGLNPKEFGAPAGWIPDPRRGANPFKMMDVSRHNSVGNFAAA